MQQIIEKIKQKVPAGELFRVNYKSIPIDYEMNQLKSINAEELEGWALRIIQNNKIGFSSATSQEQINRMLEKAIEVSQFGQKAYFNFPEKIIPATDLNLQMSDKKIKEKTIAEMIEEGNKIIKKINSINADFRCDAGLTKQESTVEYYNTFGGSFQYEQTMFAYSVMVQNTTENDMLMLMESQQWGSDSMPLDIFWEKLEQKIKWSSKIVDIESGNMPVIFTPKALLVLILPFISGLNGRSVNKKISPLGDKKGQLVWSPLFSMYSDGTIDYAGGSAPYDDEGIKMQRLPLIKNGVLENYYYDLQNAAEAEVEPTGNGLRPGYSSPPAPGISNLVIPEGEMSMEEMIKDIKEGIIVDQVLGLGQGNVLSGSFSNNVQLGFKIKNGQVTGRVKNVMIAGNAFEVMKNILGVGEKATWVSGQYHFPHVYLKSLPVSAKKQ